MKIEASGRERPFTTKLVAHFELTKPRVTLLVVFTTAAGFYLASSGRVNLVLLVHALLGTALVAGGTAVLNQFLEREADGRMQRTRTRPLPSGRLDASDAVIFGGVLVCGGTLYLGLLTNLLAAFLACATAVLYLFVYTPLKMKTPICTAIGAIPGAAPPLIGWAAAKGHLDFHALLLFAILFTWQFPHFLAIFWIYKEDYQRGGFTMLSSVDPDGKRTSRHILAFSILLFFLSVGPWMWGLAGMVYLVGAVLLGSALIWFGFEIALCRSITSARHVLRASVAYLPLLLILMLIDKTNG